MTMNALITAEEVSALARPIYADEEIVSSIIAESEREDIKPRIGDRLYLTLKTKAVDELTNEESLLLNGGQWTSSNGDVHYLEGLKTALAYFVYSRIVRDGNIQSTRYGARIKSDENSTSTEDTERQRQYRQAFASADRYLAECLAFINRNSTALGECGREKKMRSNRTKFRVVGTGGGAASSAVCNSGGGILDSEEIIKILGYTPANAAEIPDMSRVYEMPDGGIPESDLSKDVQDALAKGKTASSDLSTFRPEVERALSERVRYADVVDGLDSTETDKPLSANQGRVLKDGQTAIESKTDLISVYSISSSNLLNPDNWQVGYVNQNGFLDTSESYRYQEIDIRELDTATLLNCITDANASAPARFYCFKNDAMGNGEKISGGQSSSSFSVPEGATRLFVSFSYAYLSDKGVGVFAGESPTWEPYVAPLAYLYGQWGDTEDGNAIARKKDIGMSNPLYRKKWVACGDSFTAGAFTGSHTNDYVFTEGKYAGQMKVYPYFIGNRNEGLVVVNEAIGGSTITSGTGKSPFSDSRVLNIPTDADYITLRFGINDTSAAVPMGTIDSTDKTTFYGAWNYVLDYLTTNFPYAKIGIIVGEGMQNADGQEYAKAEIEVAKKWGIQYLNIQFESGSEKIPLTFRTSNPNVSSEAIQKKFNAFVVDAETNWHPNEKAHEYESTFIEAWLKSL